MYVAIVERRFAVDLPKGVMEAAVSAGLPSSSVDAVLGAISNGTAAAMDAVPSDQRHNPGGDRRRGPDCLFNQF